MSIKTITFSNAKDMAMVLRTGAILQDEHGIHYSVYTDKQWIDKRYHKNFENPKYEIANDGYKQVVKFVNIKKE